MSKQGSSAGVGDLSLRLDVIDNALRTKYMRIVECLSMNELKKFNKFTYQEIIKSDISDLFPEVIYIYLGQKAMTQAIVQNRRRNRSSKHETE